MYQQYEVEDMQNPFEEEHTTTVVIGSTHIDSTHTRVVTHSAACLQLTQLPTHTLY